MIEWLSVFKNGKSKSGQVEPSLEELELSAIEAEQARQKNREILLLEREWKKLTYDHLLERIDVRALNNLPAAQAREQIGTICRKMLDDSETPLSESSRERVLKQLENDVLGLGPLEELLGDDSISDIMVNGSQQVYVERRGTLELTHVVFDDDQHLMKIIERIVSMVGRRLDEQSPMVDARLKDGSRVNVIIPPLALDGPMMSIRRFTVEKLDMANLIEFGSLNSAIARVLEVIVKLRLNVLISGGTGSGKTTLLNILSGFIPASERIVTIEDSAELQLQQPHVVRLETRPPDLEGRGEVTQRELVKNSLRMRPDRIVIGEVRGAEVMDMLQAMSTGHDGSLATIHGNTPRDALGRVENMIALAGFVIPLAALRHHITSAIDIVVQTQRLEDGSRRVTSIQEIDGMEGDMITMAEIFRFEQSGVDENGKVIGDYYSTGIVPNFYNRLKARGMELDINVFREGEDREWNG